MEARGIDDPGPTVRAVILTGGRSRRFGGVHKPGVTVDGRPVLARVLASVRSCDPTAEVRVAGPLDGLEDAERAPVRSIVESPRFGGPLAGVTAALDDLQPRDSTVLVLAGDVPHLDPTDLSRLIDASHRTGRAACGEDGSGRLQPLLSAWPEVLLRARLHEIGDVTDQPVRLLWDRREQPVPVPVSTASTDDVDTPDDYRRITGTAPPPP